MPHMYRYVGPGPLKDSAVSAVIDRFSSGLDVDLPAPPPGFLWVWPDEPSSVTARISRGACLACLRRASDLYRDLVIASACSDWAGGEANEGIKPAGYQRRTRNRPQVLLLPTGCRSLLQRAISNATRFLHGLAKVICGLITCFLPGLEPPRRRRERCSLLCQRCRPAGL